MLHALVNEEADVPINDIVSSINELMRRKLSLLFEFYRYTSDEYDYVREESMEQLGSIIVEKQEIINEINFLDRKFLVDFSSLKERLGISSLDELKNRGEYGSLTELKLNTKEIMNVLSKIDTLDKKVNAKIAKLRTELTSDLTRIQKQRNISTLYSGDKPKKNVSPGQKNVYSGSSFDRKK